MNTKPSSPSRTYYDVVVAGGGPAGAAMATFLARAGHSCLVFDQSKFPRYHIGESLIPHTFGVLDRLGLLPKLRASDFPLKDSVRFVAWNGDESAPFYFSETIPGERAVTWRVERAVFDRLLKDMSGFTAALELMSPPPPPLTDSRAEHPAPALASV